MNTNEPQDNIPEPVGVSEDNEADLIPERRHPLFNSIVLDKMFKNLEVKDVKKLRLVCHTWEEAASRSLSNENDGAGLGICFENKTIKQLNEFPEVLAFASKDFFKKANIWNLNTSNTTRQAKLILPLFGVNLVTLHFDVLHCKLLLEILTEYCPSLEELQIEYLQGKEGIPSRDQLDFRQSLNLKTFAFHLNCGTVDCCVQKNLLGMSYDDLLAAIIRASPHLTFLNCKNSNPCTTAGVFRLMKDAPENLKNLQKLEFLGIVGSTHRQDPFQELIGMDFKKLKTLTIRSSNSKLFPSLQISKFLTHVSGTLEKLSLGYVSYVGNLIPDRINSYVVIPSMPKLTEFKYLVQEMHHIKTADLLIKMPRLRAFFLVGTNIRSTPAVADTERVIFSFAMLSRNPNRNLTSLYLPGVVASSEVIRAITQGAPNVSSLLIHSSKTDKNKCLVGFEMFSKMQNLRNLTLIAKNLEVLTNEVVDMTFSMQPHQQPSRNPLSSLSRRLSIKSGHGRSPSPNWLKKAFTSIPTLQKLTVAVFRHNVYRGIKSDQSLLKFAVSLEFSDIWPISSEDCSSTHHQYFKVGENCPE